uniref:Homeobox domain-containing protein n=1 Tax=Rhabditophanes sp. KR3021 TaxID=114890 RepID=A0AC35U4R1_9BILA
MSMIGDKQIKFTNIMGQGRINQLGGMFINGRPLPHHIRIKIIDLAKNGIKPCHISRQLKVSHGAVSKILNRFAETGSVSPGQVGGASRLRLSIQAVEKQIDRIMDENPQYVPNDIRRSLIDSNICSHDNAPTISSIKRLFKSKEFRKSSSVPVESENTTSQKLSFGIDHILSNDTISYISRKRTYDASSTLLEKNMSSNSEIKRNRTSFTPQQLKILENLFTLNTYPDGEEREKVSKITNLSEEKIMTWFSNRRARCRKNISINTSEHEFLANPLLSNSTDYSPLSSSCGMPLTMTSNNNNIFKTNCPGNYLTTITTNNHLSNATLVTPYFNFPTTNDHQKIPEILPFINFGKSTFTPVSF